MSKVHVLCLGDGEPFRHTEGGLVWHRAPDRNGAAQVFGPKSQQPIPASHMSSIFVIPTRPDWQDRSPRHGH